MFAIFSNLSKNRYFLMDKKSLNQLIIDFISKISINYDLNHIKINKYDK